MINFDEMYETVMGYLYEFSALPGEQQLLMGVGALAALAATRSFWGIIRPVRWIAAMVLVLTSRLLHSNKASLPSLTSSNGFRFFGLRNRSSADITFDVSSKAKHRQTVRHFAGSQRKANELSMPQLRLLRDSASIYGVTKKMWMDPIHSAYADTLASEKVNRLIMDSLKYDADKALHAQ